ncbi:hypothetical protein Aperf_G00000015390 [Anoplocephala perfoliata]
MDDVELANIRKYLHAIQRSYPKRCDSCSPNRLNELVTITDSKLFEEIITRTYQYEEYLVKRNTNNTFFIFAWCWLLALLDFIAESKQRRNLFKRIERRRLSPATLLSLQCMGLEFTNRIRTLKVPPDAIIHEVLITDPGSSVLERMHHSSRRSRDLKPDSLDMNLNWKCIGLRFGRIESIDDGLYIDNVKRENPGTLTLMRGDQILAMEGIVFDKVTLDAVNQDAQLTSHDSRSIPIAVTTYYEIATSLLDSWVAYKWPDTANNQQRLALQLTIARCDSTVESITPVPEPECSSIHFGSRKSCNPETCEVQTSRKLQQFEEDYIEIELIDYPKTPSGVGAFLTPRPDGLGACVERLAEGELADQFIKYANICSYLCPLYLFMSKIFTGNIIFLENPTDGRLQVDDTILYINENPVMNKSFKEVLGIYRQISSRAENNSVSTPVSSLQPIRLIVSRPMNKKTDHPSQTTSSRILTVPRGSVLLEAAKMAAAIGEETKNLPDNSAPTNAKNSDMANLYEDPESAFVFRLNHPLGDLEPTGLFFMPPDFSDSDTEPKKASEIERGVVIEEVISDDASEKAVSPKAPIENAGDDEDDDELAHKISLSSGYYQAYPAHSTVINAEKPPANQRLSDEKRNMLRTYWQNILKDDAEIVIGEFKLSSETVPLGMSVETLASVDVKGRQTDFRHRIVELKEGGIIATQTDLKPEDEILEVCGVVVMGKDSTFFTNILRESRNSGYLVCSRPLHSIPNKAFRMPNLNPDKTTAPSTENTQSDVGSTEIESGIERGESSPQETVHESPRLVMQSEKVGQSQNGRRMSDEVKNFYDVRHGPSNNSLDLGEDSVEIFITKMEGELIGITLGPRDEDNGGFVVTDIASNGALQRTLNSVAAYRDLHFGIGDIVTEVNGEILRGATLFKVQSILWGLFPAEGKVR